MKLFCKDRIQKPPYDCCFFLVAIHLYLRIAIFFFLGFLTKRPLMTQTITAVYWGSLKNTIFHLKKKKKKPILSEAKSAPFIKRRVI